MARTLYGGRPGDTVVSLFALGSRKLLSLPTDLNGDPTSVTLTVYDAAAGTQVTDLVAADGVTAITAVAATTEGQIPAFFGPDEYTDDVWLKDPEGDYTRLDAGPGAVLTAATTQADRAETARTGAELAETGAETARDAADLIALGDADAALGAAFDNEGSAVTARLGAKIRSGVGEVPDALAGSTVQQIATDVPPLIAAQIADANPAIAAAAADYAAAGNGVLTVGSAPQLAENIVPDPQLKTSGSQTTNYIFTRITTGLPAGFVYGVETTRSGGLTGQVSIVVTGGATQSDPLRIPVVPGETIHCSAFQWSDTAPVKAIIAMMFYDASNAFVSIAAGVHTEMPTASTWTETPTGPIVVPAGAAYVRPRTAVSTLSGNTTTGAKCRVTGIQVASSIEPYGDGTREGWAWTGTAHESRSKKVFVTATDLANAGNLVEDPADPGTYLIGA